MEVLNIEGIRGMGSSMDGGRLCGLMGGFRKGDGRKGSW